MSAPSTVYFVRHGITRPIYFSGTGDRIHFEDIGDDTGLLATNNLSIIGSLRLYQSQQRMGVMEIGLEEYDAKKKLANDGQRRLNSVRGRSSNPIIRVDRPEPAASAAVENKSYDPSLKRVPGASQTGHPLEVPDSIPAPPSMKKPSKPEAKKGKKAVATESP